MFNSHVHRLRSRSRRHSRPEAGSGLRGPTAAVAAFALTLLAVLGGGAPAHAAAPVVSFPDALLKACVQQSLGLTGPDVTVAELQTLVELSCSGRGITDTRGLGQASAPASLDLSNNELLDIGGLAGLAELKRLDVSSNRLQGIAVLRGLGRLQTIDASYNTIATLGDLSTLNDLDSIDVSHNAISTAAAFAGGAVLRAVNLSFNLLSDAQFASRLTQVSELDLSYNRVTSAVSVSRLSAKVDLQNQTVQLPAVLVDTSETLPVVRGVNLDSLFLRLAGDSQAYGAYGSQGFTWRSNGVGQLTWLETNTRPAGNVVTFSGRFVQTVTRGTLTSPVPRINGVATVGRTLTASAGAWGPAPVVLSYQWKRDGADVAGATSAGYAVMASDLGTTLSVAVTGSKTSYTTVMTVSAGTAPVVAARLTVTPVPKVSGTLKVGQTLTAASGAWAPAPVALSYQWNRGGTAIAGATATTYTLVNADSGFAVTVTVTGAKVGYAGVSKTSMSSVKVTGGEIVPVTPKIVGGLVLGKTLSVETGVWTPAPVVLTYHWNRDGVVIPGATAPTYPVTAADLTKSITVTVDGARAGYAPVSRTSEPAAQGK